MKAIYVIIFLLSNIFCSAQVNIEKGHYYEVPELKELEGTWIGTTDGTDSLVLELQSTKSFLKGLDIYMDRLVGKHYYYQNGILTEKFTEESPNLGDLDQKSPEVVLLFSFLDNKKQKSGDLKLKLTSLNSKQAKWILKNKEGAVFLRPDGKKLDGSDYNRGFSVPTEILLKKIN